MKSLAKALIIITCLLCACWMVVVDQVPFGCCFFVFGGAITVFYEAVWK